MPPTQLPPTQLPPTRLPPESAVIVPVPEAEPAVGHLRSRLDPAAAEGVPAHVTVLYPFVPPALIDARVLAKAGEAVRTVPSFRARFTSVEWFGDQVVWLSPEPARAFAELIIAVCERFPEYPPYGGVHAEVVPHLTVGDGAPTAELRRAAELVRGHLPISTEVATAHVICGSSEPGSWHTIAELPLGRR
ncbi:2'-5' RNA ligase family protein [Actinopolymorpha singaporensis]|uniref:2'-5' RNA ligase family protein n=1 Tax=Actinopolymorpha singaporensis TaxID=117157 RepID=UPI000B8569FC|nr:2'-5' RNA ligase family protein [Actinopolymorpha singaporensis]